MRRLLGSNKDNSGLVEKYLGSAYDAVHALYENLTDILASEANATEAKNWANTPEDALVPEGDGIDDYSALHHARKASASKTSAATSETNAAASASAAATSETNAAASKTSAATSATNAAASASAAAASEANAAASEGNAAADAAEAYNWAQYPENSLVPGGNGIDQYSAFHWAQKAAASASGSAVNISYDNFTSGLAAMDVQAAIDEMAGGYLPLLGGSLTGALTLPADPVNALEAATKQYTDAADAGRSITSFGAVGDGVTDDKAAFEAAEALGVSPIMLPSGTYRLSGGPGSQNVSYHLRSDASVVLDGALTWSPRRWERDGVTPYSRKINPSASSPAVPAENYTILTDSPGAHDYWSNQWGYQEPDTDGKLSGAAPAGKIPVGQTRLARTGTMQLYLQGLHSGEGDGYSQYASMAVSQHGRVNLVTAWGGQNSGGLWNGQAAALTDQVNLYGMGDVVLKDNGHSDVSMLGHVLYLDREGADVAAYAVPRFAYMANSRGSLDADAAFIARGKFYSGLDFAGATLSSAFALTLAADQRIGFDAGTPNIAGGKFHSEAPGAYWIYKNASALKLVADNTAIGQFFSDRVEIRPGANQVFGLRVFGSSATAFASIGQFNAISYLSAGSIGADNTLLALRTTAAGTEADRLVIESAGHVRPGANNTLDLGKAAFLWANVYANTYRDVNANQVVSARRIGWATPTGIATRTAFDTTTATTAELAERLKALIDDLTAHGLIGL